MCKNDVFVAKICNCKIRCFLSRKFANARSALALRGYLAVAASTPSCSSLVGGRFNLQGNTLTTMPAYLSSPLITCILPPRFGQASTFTIRLPEMEMVSLLNLFFVLICFHSFASHPDVGIFEENDGRKFSNMGCYDFQLVKNSPRNPAQYFLQESW